jgi:hypothetical protein
VRYWFQEAVALLKIPESKKRRKSRSPSSGVFYYHSTRTGVQHMPTTAQINANRANARLDEPAILSEAKTQERFTGPTSEAGKAKSSLNAVKTGLTGRTVLLPTDDVAAYEQHVQRFFDKHKPASDAERTLVQSLADTEWRLLRIPTLEAGIYALGRLEFAELFPEQEPAVRQQLIETKVFLTYQRQLNNLSIQEGRLRRQREKDEARLKETKAQRIKVADLRLGDAAKRYLEARREGKPFDPTQFGFEFSMEQIERRAAILDFARHATSLPTMKVERTSRPATPAFERASSKKDAA